MTELELLGKEIRDLLKALERAGRKPNVTQQELDSIHMKLQLKRSTYKIVKRYFGGK